MGACSDVLSFRGFNTTQYNKMKRLDNEVKFKSGNSYNLTTSLRCFYVEEYLDVLCILSA